MLHLWNICREVPSLKSGTVAQLKAHRAPFLKNGSSSNPPTTTSLLAHHFLPHGKEAAHDHHFDEAVEDARLLASPG